MTAYKTTTHLIIIPIAKTYDINKELIFVFQRAENKSLIAMYASFFKKMYKEGYYKKIKLDRIETE